MALIRQLSALLIFEPFKGSLTSQYADFSAESQGALMVLSQRIAKLLGWKIGRQFPVQEN
jgi:hypothetical protein